MQRRWDVIEIHAEKGLASGLTAVGLFAFAWMLYAFRGEGMFVPLAIILSVIAVILFGIAINQAIEIRKIDSYAVECPYCEATNELTTSPETDFACQHCHRMIPVVDGHPLPVHQVRCGYCNEINYYSDKTEVLICESCSHEIPITVSDGKGGKVIPKGFTVQEDDNLYEFELVAFEHKTEDMINTLQHLLALNRNQIKQMLDELPVTILTGITRRKAEMLQAQLSLHGVATDFRPVREDSSTPA